MSHPRPDIEIALVLENINITLGTLVRTWEHTNAHLETIADLLEALNDKTGAEDA